MMDKQGNVIWKNNSRISAEHCPAGGLSANYAANRSYSVDGFEKKAEEHGLEVAEQLYAIIREIDSDLAEERSK